MLLLIALIIAAAAELPSIRLEAHKVPRATLKNAMIASKMTMEHAMEISQDDPYSPFRNFQGKSSMRRP